MGGFLKIKLVSSINGMFDCGLKGHSIKRVDWKWMEIFQKKFMGFWKSNYSEPIDFLLNWIVKGVVTCGNYYFVFLFT
jgi:hypothetical protein